MTDLKGIIDVRGPQQPSEFLCEASVGSNLFAACGLAEEQILWWAARAVEMAVGMAEIHAGTAATVDRTVFPLPGNAVAEARLDPSPVPWVVV